MAGSGLGVPDKVAQGLTPRAYIYTDRPAYRPGQEVALRGVVREVKDGQYANVPGADYRARGRPTAGGGRSSPGTVTLSEFGTFHERLPLDEGAPVGTYRVRLYQPGKSEFAGQFEVQSYQLADDRPGLRPQEDGLLTGARRSRPTSSPATSTARRSPAGRSPSACPTAARAGDDRRRRASFTSSSPTEGFAEEQALRLVAQLPQDNVAAAASVMLAVHGFGDRPGDDPRRLPRRRVVRAPGHDPRRPGRADRARR